MWDHPGILSTLINVVVNYKSKKREKKLLVSLKTKMQQDVRFQKIQ